MFTCNLIRDLLTYPLLEGATLALMDIGAQRLDFSRRSAEKIITMGNYSASVQPTTDRARALKDADAVICTILAGDTKVWRHDIEIPMKYGIDINIGDTRDPSGIFRALRTIPVMLEIVRDAERYCPDAIFLNYTNPMAMNCRAIQRESPVCSTGLGHSVQGTAMMLARWIGAPFEEIAYTCAGINHLAWYLKYEWNDKDAYPLIRKAVSTKPEIYNEEIVRNEMFLHLSYYVTESSGHNSEYNWWFWKRPDLIENYCTHGTGWNPGMHAHILHEYQTKEQTWKGEARKWFAADTPIDLAHGHEFAAPIINAWLGGEIYGFNGNLPNTGLVTNLPDSACVEIPAFVDKGRFHPVHVGALPPQCTILSGLNSQIEEMAVKAALTGDPTLVYQAIAYDPLSAAALSLVEQFEHFSV